MKCVLAFVVMLFLTASAFAPVSMAAQNGVMADTEHDYVTAYSCPLHVAPGSSDPVSYTVSKGKAIHGINGTNSSWAYNNSTTYVSYNISYYGYAENKKIVPMTKSYKVTTATYLYLTASTNGGLNPNYQSTMPVGTILYVISTSNGFRYGYGYVNGARYIGYIVQGNTARTYGG